MLFYDKLKTSYRWPAINKKNYLLINNNYHMINRIVLVMSNTVYISMNNAFLMASMIEKIILLWIIFKEVKKSKKA